MNLLFVCTGNTCRSPMAEVIARAEAEARGLPEVSCASAGIYAAPGAPAAEHGIAVAASRGLDLAGHAAQPLSHRLMAWADAVIAMEPVHADTARYIDPDASVHLMSDFLAPAPGGGQAPAEAETEEAPSDAGEGTVEAEGAAPEAEPRRSGAVAPAALAGDSVPDPVGGDREEYEATWALLQLAIAGLFDRLGEGAS